MPRPPQVELRTKAIALMRQGKINGAIARELDVSESTVRYWRQQAGLPPSPGKPGRRPAQRKAQPPRPPREPRRRESYYLPVQLIDAVRNRAEREGSTASAIVERALRTHMGRHS